mmetsp:Transcript_41013/g.76259  ORF Transcript_41013/g.76259 Transcript_41013/m.76259 type:complete len:98 (+) Transcript_41013:859-1152(+)
MASDEGFHEPLLVSARGIANWSRANASTIKAPVRPFAPRTATTGLSLSACMATREWVTLCFGRPAAQDPTHVRFQQTWVIKMANNTFVNICRRQRSM